MNDRKTSEIGSRIRALLSDRGVTQTELAGRTGIDRAELNRLINGRRLPRSDEIQRLADALGMATTELVAGVELSARAEESLAAFAQLEARAAESQQRAEVAEAKLSSLVGQIEEERQTNAQGRIAADMAYRAEQAKLREVLGTRVRLTWWIEAGSITATSEDPSLCASLGLASDLRVAFSDDPVGWRRAMEGLERDLLTLLRNRASARGRQETP